MAQDFHVFVDFETRSLAELRKTGAWKYAADPSTYPLMLAAYYPVSGRKLQWLHHEHGEECPEWVRKIAENPDLTVHAHNANFEIAIWKRVLVERWGWPDIPRNRWKDTAGLAAHANLPMSLDQVGRALKIRNKKDSKGKELIKLLSCPQKALKTYKKGGEILTNSVRYLTENGIELFELDEDQGPIWYWNNNRKALKAFAEYNERDVVAEQEVDSRVPDYSGIEAKMWELDSIINERGLPIDRELCEAAAGLYEYIYHDCEWRCEKLTNGEIKNPNSRAVLKWVQDRVEWGNSLAADFIDKWLEDHPFPQTQGEKEVSEMFVIKQLFGGSAIKKFDAALQVIEADDRARGQFFFYGASTGRWAGRGIQPHNFYRQAIPGEEVFELIKNGDFYDDIASHAKSKGMTVGELVRSCVRGLIKAPEGSTLIVSDFAGIESRVLQWLVGNENALDVFRSGADMYVHTAAKMYRLDYASMMGDDGKVKKEHKEHRQIGKAAVLGLGYQMGAGRFQAELQKSGIFEDEEFALDIVQKWRKANPLIADYERGIWRRLERAVKAVIKTRGKNDFAARVAAYSDPSIALRVKWEGDGFTIELPSERKLYYPRAEIYEGKFGPSIRYMDGGKSLVDTYGGKLVENVVQAISRDLLVNSMFLAEECGLKVIGHVHDEIIVEHELDGVELGFEELHRCMSTPPDWASTLPLEAETYESKRYTK